MPYKNKDLINALYLYFKANLTYSYTKQKINSVLVKTSYKEKKVFTLQIEDFIELSKLFYFKE